MGINSFEYQQIYHIPLQFLKLQDIKDWEIKRCLLVAGFRFKNTHLQ